LPAQTGSSETASPGFRRRANELTD
jgi:hypothetical protein